MPGEGITVIDAGYLRPRMVAIHLVEHRGRAAIVDSGTVHSVPAVLEALGSQGLKPGDVDYLLLTHVHLDHAGGAGALLARLPNARAVLHPRGAAHLVDPQRLISGSIAVYGRARFDQLYGEIVPIDKDRVHVTHDGEQLGLAGRTFEVWHTPGHALHHQAFADQGARTVFTGDTLGLSYRELDTERGALLLPTTTPTQFDPEQLLASIARIVAWRPRSVHLTHYGRIEGIAERAPILESQIGRFVEFAQAHADAPDRAERIHADMGALWLALAREHGCTLPDAELVELLAGDLELNTQGLVAWLARTRH